jgi:hypothetical protein
VSFTITGPGLYRTRDGRKAEVKKEPGSTLWPMRGVIDGDLFYWDYHGKTHPGFSGDMADLIAPWEEPVAPVEAAPTQTPYHRTEQFRAETARMFALALPADQMPLETLASWAVQSADALIAALDKPQPYTP